MPTEQDYARAKMLGMTARLARGYDAQPDAGTGQMQIDRSTVYTDDKGNNWFAATGADGTPGMYNQNTGEFTSGAIPGLEGRDSYSAVANRGKRLATRDADFEADFSKNIPNIAASVVNLDAAMRLAGDPGAAVDSNFMTRIGGEVERLMPGMGFTEFDANNITEYDNRIRNAAIQYARQSFQGQGQVTEWERRMIDEAVGQRGTLTNATAQKVLRVMRDSEQRKIDMFNEWNSNEQLKQRWNYNFGAYVGWYVNEANKRQMGMSDGGGSSDSGSASGGQRKSLGDIFGN
jgi:hypothetical protein